MILPRSTPEQTSAGRSFQIGLHSKPHQLPDLLAQLDSWAAHSAAHRFVVSSRPLDENSLGPTGKRFIRYLVEPVGPRGSSYHAIPRLVFGAREVLSVESLLDIVPVLDQNGLINTVLQVVQTRKAVMRQHPESGADCRELRPEQRPFQAKGLNRPVMQAREAPKPLGVKDLNHALLHVGLEVFWHGLLLFAGPPQLAEPPAAASGRRRLPGCLLSPPAPSRSRLRRSLEP